MPRCEDYPCCGHGTDQNGLPDCPTKDGRYKCVHCGKLLSKNATSSFCDKCLAKGVWNIEDGSMYEPRDRW